MVNPLIRNAIAGDSFGYDQVVDLGLDSVFGDLLPGAASGPVLLTRSIYADATGKLVLPDEARTTTGYAKNSDGVYEAFGSGVPLIVGARKDGSDYYATDSGGEDLDPLPYVLTSPGATNSFANSDDWTGWLTGNVTFTLNATDIFGNANGAGTLEDASGAALGSFYNDIAISLSTDTHSWRVWLAYNATPNAYPRIRIRFFGGSAVDGDWVIDPADGATLEITNTNSTGQISVTREGDFWKITVSQTDNGSGNTTLRMQISPAYAETHTTTNDNAALGTQVVCEPETFLNTAHAVAHALPPIPTSGSPLMIGITKVNAAIQPTRNFVLKFYWTPEYDDQGTVYLIGNYTDANNAWAVLHDGTNIIFRNRVSGSNNDATKALNYVVGTEYEITIWHDDAAGLHIGVDDTEGTLDSTTTDVTSVAATYIGQDGNNASAGINGVRDVRYWEGRASSWSQVTGLAA